MKSYCNQPLLILSGVAYAGISMGLCLKCPFRLLLLGAISSILAVLWCKKNTIKTIGIMVLCFFCFMMLGSQTGTTDIAKLSDKLNRRVVVVDGQWTRTPRMMASDRGWYSFLKIKTLTVNGHEMKFNKMVKVIGYTSLDSELEKSNSVRVKALFRSFDTPCNPGQFDYAHYMYDQQIIGLIVVYDRHDMMITSKIEKLNFVRIIGQVESWIRKTISHYYPANIDGWLVALVLGDRSYFDPIKVQKISLSGLAHILAISGLHLSIIFFFILKAGRVLRLPRMLGQMSALVIIVFMTCLIHGQISALRAVLMMGCSIIVWMHLAHKDAWSAWALAGLILMVANPGLIGQAGFQLSFAATAAILFTWPYLPNIKNFFMRWCCHLVILSGSIFVMTSFLTIHHFNLITPVSIISNLFALPLLTMVLISAWVQLLLAAMIPGAAVWMAAITSFLINGLEQIAFIMSRLSWGHFYVKNFPLVLIGIWFGLLFLAKIGDCNRAIKAAILSGWLLGTMIGMVINHQSDQITVTALALNKGEAFIIQHHQKTMLIDTGTQTDFIYQVYPFLKQQGINHLDAVLISHQDKDHSGGLSACLNLISTGQLLFAGSWVYEDQKLIQAIDDARTKLVEMKAMDEWELGRCCSLKALWPGHYGVRSSNDTCLVVEIMLENQRLLFTGDSPMAVEEQWLELNPCLLLKAGHHGDHKSTSDYLLNRISPQAVLVTAGLRNSYGLPDPRTIRRIRQEQLALLNTFDHGAIRIKVLPDGVWGWDYWY